MEELTQTQVEIIQPNYFVEKISGDSFIQLIETKIRENKKVQIHGLKGSLDAVVFSAVNKIKANSNLFILQDKEEALYFLNDLQSLIPDQEILFFPTSYKKPYEFLEIDNANILQRAETLNSIKDSKTSNIVTYPEALIEKVINKRSLIANTLLLSINEKIDIDFIFELLQDYGFKKVEFISEAGEYSLRGGILDIYSYANDLPYRIELFDDEIESIRVFDPVTQLSTQRKEKVSIIPDVQNKLTQEVRESFFSFLEENTKIWVKDLQLTYDTIQRGFEKANECFNQILEKSNSTQIVKEPEELFETKETFEKRTASFSIVEIGNRFYFKNAEKVSLKCQPQTSFNKNFDLLSEELSKNAHENIKSYISSESRRQLERFYEIFEEINQEAHFEGVLMTLRGGFQCEELGLAYYTDHQIFDRFHQYKSKKRYTQNTSLTLKALRSLNIGDYVTHIDYGIARFGGMDKIEVNEKQQETVRLIFKGNDLLYLSVHALHKISKYSGQEGKIPQISKLGSPEWEQKKKKVRKKVKDIAKELIELYAKRKSLQGTAFKKDSYLQAELESSFLYDDTPDQAKSTKEVKEDMEAPHPMDRLVCGDVGFGKTEIAIRAAFKAVDNDKQVAILVPTTILALQHYKTFSERLKDFPCTINYVNRFKSSTEIKKTLKELKNGKIDIIIGTHRLASKDVSFKDLGLLVIDEEQKFGVQVKERLKEFKVNVDTLTLTATPIPRTLHFSMMGARDLSVISTPPPNRQPVTTTLSVFSQELIRDAVFEELKRGGQVFFVHNKVSDIEQVANLILTLVPDARVAYAHGQMEGSRLEKIMTKFIEYEYDILVSTNIIESGLDIPNVNTIIVNNAHLFGLSDLHQMRGRVGRSNKKAYCYLLTPPIVNLPSDARKRLSALEEFSDLGDGFKVAMRDLDIRGAGNLLGAEQTGFISDVGFETYNKILEDAVKELKENEFKALFEKSEEIKLEDLKSDCVMETDLEVIIPESYVSNISERLNLYIEADKIETEEELNKFRTSLKDKFGTIPEQVEELLKSVRMRWKAQKLGIQKLTIKNTIVKAYLPEQSDEKYYQSNIFGKILSFVQHYGSNSSLKESKNQLILTLRPVHSIEECDDYLKKILES